MFRAVVGGKIDNGYALIHPPGHLAEPGRFVKSSVANFRARFKRVAIVDMSASMTHKLTCSTMRITEIVPSRSSGLAPVRYEEKLSSCKKGKQPRKRD